MTLRLSTLIKNTGKAIAQYYLMLVCALVLAVTVMRLLFLDTVSDYALIRIALVAGLGISLSFAAVILGQRKGRRFLWEAICAVLLVTFYVWVLPDKKTDFTEKYVYILIPSYIIAHLLVALAPFFSTANTKKFWQYNKGLFVNFILTLIFTLVFAGGIELALLAADNLFNLWIDDNLYAQFFFGILIFGSALIFSLFCAEGLPNLEKDEPYPVVLKFFTQFILIPLLLLYLIILYLYGIKILITWQMPQGWVSYLVLVYGVIGTLALLLVYPLLGKTSKAWINWFKKLFYGSLFPLLILLFVAIGIRIKAYGVTEARYFVVFLAIWFTFIATYYTFVKKPQLKIIPLSLFLSGLFILIIPYFNVFSVSLRSQKKQFIALLKTNQLLENGKIQTHQKISHKLIKNLNSKYRYLNDRQQQSFVVDKLNPTDKTLFAKSHYNFSYLFSTINDNSQHYYKHLYSKNQPVYTTKNYTYVIPLMYGKNQLSFQIGQDSLNLHNATITNKGFIFSVNGKDKDISSLIYKVAQPYIKANTEEIDTLSVQFTWMHYTGKFIFTNLYFTLSANHTPVSVNRVRGVLLLRKKD